MEVSLDSRDAASGLHAKEVECDSLGRGGIRTGVRRRNRSLNRNVAPHAFAFHPRRRFETIMLLGDRRVVRLGIPASDGLCESFFERHADKAAAGCSAKINDEARVGSRLATGLEAFVLMTSEAMRRACGLERRT